MKKTLQGPQEVFAHNTNILSILVAETEAKADAEKKNFAILALSQSNSSDTEHAEPFILLESIWSKVTPPTPSA